MLEQKQWEIRGKGVLVTLDIASAWSEAQMIVNTELCLGVRVDQLAGKVDAPLLHC